MNKTKYYIAYGSNLHVAQMQRRCPGAIPVGTAWMEGWRLAFRGSGSGAYLTIIPDPDGVVPVGIWKINAEHERALDRYEGFPTFYGKREEWVRVTLLHPTKTVKRRTIKAMVYIMNEDAAPGIPTQRYVTTCEVGCRCFNLPLDHLHEAVHEAIEEFTGRRDAV